MKRVRFLDCTRFTRFARNDKRGPMHMNEYHSSGGNRGFTPKQSFFGGIITGVLVLGTIGFIVLLVVFLVGRGDSAAALPLAVGPSPTAPSGPPPSAPAGDVKPVSDDDHVRGDKNAKVVVVEYSDFECPFCGRFHETMNDVMADNDDVAWVYRHFPLSFHQSAQVAAEASECVAEQGGDDAFWKFADAAFAAGGFHSDSAIEGYAAAAGVNASKFKDCLDSGKYKQHVDTDLLEGQSAGVQGTPGNFVIGPNGVRSLPGAVPAASIQAAIEAVK